MEENELTKNAAAFVAANAQIPVVMGVGYPEGGGRFTLEDGREFEFTLAEFRSIPDPKWPWDFENDGLRGKGD